MLRGRRDAYHRSAMAIALAVGGATALVQPISGDISARRVAELQPAKLAAMEAHFETRRGAPLTVGGIPDAETGTVRWGIRIPNGLSLLAFHDPDAEVVGLNDIPPDRRPNVLIVHIAFQVMVGCGTALIALAAWYWWMRWRQRGSDLLLRALVIGAPLGFLALEAGWIVTEVGRQPWVIYEIMRTSEGVTPVSEVPATLFGFSVLYLLLGAALVGLLRGLATGGPGTREGAREREGAHVA
jgi:cytochrome d ubiquinol oxidase subunit I